MPIDLLAKKEEKPRDLFATPQESYDDSWFAQVTSGVNEGLGNMLGAPVDIVNAGVGLGMAGVNKVAGTDFQPSPQPFLGSQHIKGMMGGAIKPQTSDPAKQFTRRVAEEVGASVLPGMGAVAKASKPAQVAAGLGASAAGSGVGAATAEQLAPDNAMAEFAGQMVGGIAPNALVAGINKHMARKAAEAAVPSTADLKTQANAFYDEAGALGVTGSKSAVQKVANKFDDILNSEGIMLGDEVAGEYPKLRTVRQRIQQAAQGDMTVDQMQTMRKSLQKAAGSLDKDEARVAVKLLKEFDGFTAPLAPQLSEARGLYHRAAKAETLEQLEELAGSRAGQFSGSGYENALRTEFRGLERKLIKGTEKGFSQAERDAISRVAQGTTGSNIARGIGKLKPSGPISSMASIGVPGIAGTMAGGPMLGLGMAGAGATLGASGRKIATDMGLRNAEIANLLVRNGGALPNASGITPEMQKVVAALLAAQAANQSPR